MGDDNDRGSPCADRPATGSSLDRRREQDLQGEGDEHRGARRAARRRARGGLPPSRRDRAERPPEGPNPAVREGHPDLRAPPARRAAPPAVHVRGAERPPPGDPAVPARPPGLDPRRAVRGARDQRPDDLPPPPRPRGGPADCAGARPGDEARRAPVQLQHHGSRARHPDAAVNARTETTSIGSSMGLAARPRGLCMYPLSCSDRPQPAFGGGRRSGHRPSPRAARGFPEMVTWSSQHPGPISQGSDVGTAARTSGGAEDGKEHERKTRCHDDGLCRVGVGQVPPRQFEQEALHDRPKRKHTEPRREKQVRRAPFPLPKTEAKAPEARQGARRDDPESQGHQDPVLGHGLPRARRRAQRHRKLIQIANPTATVRWRASLATDHSFGRVRARSSVVTHPATKIEKAVPKSRTRPSFRRLGVASRETKMAKTQARETSVISSRISSRTTGVPPAQGPVRESEREDEHRRGGFDREDSGSRPPEGPNEVEDAVGEQRARKKEREPREGPVHHAEPEGEVHGRDAGGGEGGEAREVPDAHPCALLGRRVTANVASPASTNPDSTICAVMRFQSSSSKSNPSMNDPNAMSVKPAPRYSIERSRVCRYARIASAAIATPRTSTAVFASTRRRWSMSVRAPR